jgi:endogenous inhibitor of DNA gyrase (YacG/DUF329 family)
MKCPGKDGASWKPEDVFEVPCAECGAPVEFFKDDIWRECPECGRLAKNPKLDLGCAAWCASAGQCAVGNADSDDPSGQNASG